MKTKQDKIFALKEQINNLQKEIEELEKYELNEIEEYILSLDNVQISEAPVFNYNLTQLQISDETFKDNMTDVVKICVTEIYSYQNFESLKDCLKNYLKIIIFKHSSNIDSENKIYNTSENFSTNNFIQNKHDRLFLRMVGITSEMRINTKKNNNNE